MSIEPGALYVVATPIGNLEDITHRALAVLRGVDAILAEDTRHSARLLRHYAVNRPLIAFHEHNERRMTPKVVSRLEGGQSLALISDAGTPLINDPGYHLINTLREHGLPVIPVPGPSAFLCALSVAGLPTDRFVFEGFVPTKAGARRSLFAELAEESRTLVFYEAPHRIRATLADLVGAFGPERRGAIARELTKVFETIRTGTLSDLSTWLNESTEKIRGEFVILVQGASSRETRPPPEQPEDILRVLLTELPLKQAVSLTVRLTGRKRNEVYRTAVEVLGKTPK